MKSSNFRILTDDTGKKYQFDSERFSETVKNRSGRTKKTEDRRNHKTMTQIFLMNLIADKAGVSTDAVKNWKSGANGPSTMEMVKACADVLEVEYTDLLIPLEDQEEKKMNKKDRELVETVFEEIISLAYLVKKQHNELLKVKDNKERNTITTTVNKEILAANIEQIHKTVDTCSLLVSESVRYKLHRILIEVNDFYIERTWGIARWEDINTIKKDGIYYYDIDMIHLDHYRYALSRENGVLEMGFYYIDDEIELAENLGYYENNSVPEELWDKADIEGWGFTESGRRMELEEIAAYGFQGSEDSGTELDPQIVAVDKIVRLMKGVFRHDFPEMEIE